MQTRLKVIIQPRSSKNEIVGFREDAIKVKVKAPPVDGAANKELIRFLAKILGISKSNIVILTGRTSREKWILVQSLSFEEVLRRLNLEE